MRPAPSSGPSAQWVVGAASVPTAAGASAHGLPLSRTHPPRRAWLLTLNVGGLGGLEEVVLKVQLRVLGQRAPQRLGQHGLEQVYPAQCAAHGVQPQRLLLPQDGAPQVGLSCTGQPSRARQAQLPGPPPPHVTRWGQVRASGFVLRSTGRPRRSCQVWTVGPQKSLPRRVPLLRALPGRWGRPAGGWLPHHQPRGRDSQPSASPSFLRSSGSCGSDGAGGPRKTCCRARSSGGAAGGGRKL